MLPIMFQVNWSSVKDKKRKTDFQDGGHSGHLRFPIGTILAIFYLQSTLVLPTKSQQLAFRTGEAKIDLSDGGYGGHLGF